MGTSQKNQDQLRIKIQQRHKGPCQKKHNNDVQDAWNRDRKRKKQHITDGTNKRSKLGSVRPVALLDKYRSIPIKQTPRATAHDRRLCANVLQQTGNNVGII